jgi:hypothetical protein
MISYVGTAIIRSTMKKKMIRDIEMSVSTHVLHEYLLDDNYNHDLSKKEIRIVLIWNYK